MDSVPKKVIVRIGSGKGGSKYAVADMLTSKDAVVIFDALGKTRHKELGAAVSELLERPKPEVNWESDLTTVLDSKKE